MTSHKLNPEYFNGPPPPTPIFHPAVVAPHPLSLKWMLEHCLATLNAAVDLVGPDHEFHIDTLKAAIRDVEHIYEECQKPQWKEGLL